MNSLEFTAAFGGIKKRVKLFKAHGGPEGYQILIDNYFFGYLYFKDGNWMARLGPSSALTMADIQAFGERIDDAGMERL